MSRIAITGIGGFIGLRMAQRALELGWQVSGIDVSEAAVARARALGADARLGDVTDGATLAPAFTGADWVFHTAAVVQEDGPRELYERINNGGTETVCQTARACGVRRLVHLSSIMVYGFDYPDQVTEEGPFDGSANLYNETKLSSERIALNHHAPDQDFGVIVIRPGDVYGLGSVPWVHRPLDAMKAGQFILPDGGMGVINHVHVDNLIDGVLLAVQHDACGQAYNLTDDAAPSCKEYFGHLLRMLNRQRVPTAPAWLLRGGLKLAWALGPRLGITPPMQPAALRFLTRQHKISCDRARNELGYRPKLNLTQGMQQLATELRAAGHLNRARNPP